MNKLILIISFVLFSNIVASNITKSGDALPLEKFNENYSLKMYAENCSDSLSVLANPVYPVKISFTKMGLTSDYIGLIVYAEDSTTAICSIDKYITESTDTTIFLNSGKYYLAWVQGGAFLNNPTLSGPDVSVNYGGWRGMTNFVALPFKVIPKSNVCEGEFLLNANVDYKGKGKLKYKWTPSLGLNNDTIARPTATISNSQTYTVSVESSFGCVVSSSVDLLISPLTVNAGADKNIICGNKTSLNTITTNYSGTGKLRYKWTPSTGLDNDTIATPKATISEDITYNVTVTAPSGCTALDDIRLVIKPLVANAGADKSVVCGSSVQLGGVTTNYTGTEKLRYKWTPSSGLSNDTVANPIATVLSNTIYTVTVTTPIGCTASDVVAVNITPMAKPEIGIVGVSGNKNRVVWTKPVSSEIASYSIYKETNVSGVYAKVGSVLYDSLSLFVDSLSAPDVKSNKYKLSVTDLSGLESELSNAHKTMHLSINKGQNNAWNLIWESYEGFPISTYNIYRGTSPNSLNFLDATSGSSTQYSDFSAPVGNLYYQLEIISPIVISPTKAPFYTQKIKGVNNEISASYSSSRSNVATNILDGIDELVGEKRIIISPNPIKNEFKIDFEGGSDFDILNLTGQIVYSGNLKFNDMVNSSGFRSGIYLIRFTIGSTFCYAKIIKE